MGILGNIVKVGSLGLVDLDKPAEEAQDAANRQAGRVASQSAADRALNIERYGAAEERLSPYLASELAANEQMQIEMGLAPGEAGTAYMSAPGYQAQLDERRRGAEQSVMSGGGTAYGGRRIDAAAEATGGVQQSYYNNYMSMLDRMSQPTATQNLSALGVNQGMQMGNQAQQALQQAGNYRMQAANIPMAQQADQMSFLGNIGGALMRGGASMAGGGTPFNTGTGGSNVSNSTNIASNWL